VNSTPTLNGQELELFRVGDYGSKGRYTAADIAGVVQRYSAAGESPIAIGHPKTDAEPAFGWLKAVRFDGQVLHGTPGDVHSVLDQGWQNKMYRNRSIAFGRDPQGQLYIHHVAFLGAVPPVVQGLRDAKFSNDPYETVAFSDSGEDMPNEADVKKTVLDTLREFFSSKEQQTQTVDTEAITASVTKAVEAKFSADLEAERAERKRVEAEFATHRQQFADGGAKARVDLTIADLKTSGAWVPAYDKVGVPELFSALAKQTETITFSDAAGVEKKLDLVTAFSDTLKAVGKIVPAGQLFSATASVTKTAAPDANGAEVDPASVTFSEMVQKFSDDNKVPYTVAYAELVKQGKRPPSASTATGAV
jgi:hypothetical protein